ncbi:Per os infectivity factor 1 [Perigonia lusca single nucleopolyhedrovirus]|uniref:Per os infectivity factor 1 n=1 Tax=Perigonia lusca single nucleopolyhedrovirus TaxID=1675865 RepID=A0A0M3WNK2_9ABAC|nr:Per os infectivity factor 1 [Perigonia lusca single nucleopolyhedrovirus]AKN80682.1 Per os infectivity factor 1 [Perigonia lusca single nucleopolyhedrovirus]
MLIVITLVIIAMLVIVVSVVINFNAVLVDMNNAYETESNKLFLFDNSTVPLIDPPTEIIIENNTHECHKQLTPCTTHSDCDLCREGLANCQYFDQTTIIRIPNENGQDDIELTIHPGESYCMALDRQRARSCNPNTGIWVLTQSSEGYFSLLCNCLTPGLVTQLNLYEDCNVAVGCAPNGRILDINQTPFQCVCDEGYVADYNNQTETPFCRPKTIRDIIYDQTFFHRAPCEDGFVRVDHPALDDSYRQQLRLGDICVVDPCSIDPINNQRTNGRLVYMKDEQTGAEYKYCNCPFASRLLSVYNSTLGMLGFSSGNVVNACIQPFATNFFSIPRIDYKNFWARSDTLMSDDEVIAIVNPVNMTPAYRSILFPVITEHPYISNAVGNYFIFKVSTAYTPIDVNIWVSPNVNHSLFMNYFNFSERITAPCVYPGEGRCITVNPNYCVRRHNNYQVTTAETFTNSWCYFSRDNRHVRIWSRATRYPLGRCPIAFVINGLFSLDSSEIEHTTLNLVLIDRLAAGQENQQALTNILATFPNYSVN